MTRDKRLTSSRRKDTATGTSVETCNAGPSRSARREEARSQVSGGEKQCTNNQPRLPKDYHIRSAIEAVLECLAEHISS